LSVFFKIFGHFARLYTLKVFITERMLFHQAPLIVLSFQAKNQSLLFDPSQAQLNFFLGDFSTLRLSVDHSGAIST